MAQNVTIQGASYSDVPSVLLPKSGGGVATFMDTSDANAVAANLYNGTTAYVNGSKITGTALFTGGVTKDANGFLVLADTGTPTTVLTLSTMRPDVQKVKTWTYDKYIVDDEGISIGSYSTSEKTLLASSTLSSDTYTYSYNDYNGFLVIRMLAIPSYSITSNGKGRVEYWCSNCMYEFTDVPPNLYKSILNPSHMVTSRTIATYQSGNYIRLVYYSAANTLAAYSTAAYGTFMTVQAPSISSGKVTFKTPILKIRGHATYFTSTYYNALTDIRYQYIAELYIAPKNNLNFDGFDMSQGVINICNDVNNNNGTLR